jgi:hypothetical protein
MSVFVYVREDAMRQICGRPLYELSWLGKRALEIDKQTGPPSKRPRGPAGKPASSSEVLLSRQSIFYAHYTKSALKKLVGLAPDSAPFSALYLVYYRTDSTLQMHSLLQKRPFRKHTSQHMQKILQRLGICQSIFGRHYTRSTRRRSSATTCV